MAVVAGAPRAVAAPEGAPAEAKPGPDAPPSAEALKEARVHYERGVALYSDGEFKLALIEFRRSYELAPSYKILFNIGQATLQLNSYAEALTALEQYLKDGGKEIPAARREQVEKDIVGLKARTAHVTVTTNVPDALIHLDDAPPLKSPVTGLLIDAGTHRITVTKDGYVTQMRSVTLAPGDDGKVDVELAEVPKAQRIVERHEIRVDGREPASYTWLGWVATGAFVAGATTTGILSLNARADMRSKLEGPTTEEDVEADRSRARTLGYVTDALAGAAIITAGVTLYFTLKKPSKKSNGDVRVGFDPGAIRVSGRF